jgi:hypothetical protein
MERPVVDASGAKMLDQTAGHPQGRTQREELKREGEDIDGFDHFDSRIRVRKIRPHDRTGTIFL